jgi:UDP-glucose 4-epimerase
MDNLSGGFKRNINKDCIFEYAELADNNAVERIFRKYKPEVVYHLSADATEGRSQFTPISASKNNLMASINVFTSAIRNGVKKIIFTSSMSVYGDQQPPFDESMETRPVDVYGTNKAATENILKILCDVHGIDWVILRPHNVFGPRQNIRDAYRNVVGIFMNRIMHHKSPIIYGDGKQVRSFTYIDNVIPCFIKSLDVSREIINIGPIETQTINHLADVVLSAFDSPIMVKHVADRPMEVKYAHCTNDKAIILLGYKTKVSFEEGIKRMVKWAKQLGPQEMVYLDNLEIVNSKTPITWKEKLL